MKLKKYVIGLGSDNSGLIKGLGAADSQITAFVSKAGKLLSGLGAGAGFAKLIKDFTGIGSELKTFSDSTGLAVEDVSRLGLALEQFGGDTADAAAALNGLQDSIRQAVDWGQGPLIDVMGRYRVELQNSNGKIKTATELYYDLADVMQGLNKSQQRDLASSLGLDESSVRLLQQGRDGVEELLASRSDMAVMTKEDAEAAREWDLAAKELKQTLTGMGRDLIRTLTPAIKAFGKILEGITNFFKEHKVLIAAVAGLLMTTLVPAFVSAGISMAAAMAPLLAALAPLAAIALLIEDIAVFMQGGNSLLGDLLGDNGDVVREMLGNVFSGLGGILTKVLSGDFAGAFEEAKKLWNDTLVPVFKGLGGIIVEGLDVLWNWFKGLAADMGNWLKEAVFLMIDELAMAFGNTKLGRALGFGYGDYEFKSQAYKEKEKEIQEATGTAKKHNMDVGTYWERMREMKEGELIHGISGSTTNNASSTNNIVVNQTFNGQTDPNAVKRAAQSGVEQGAENLSYNDALAFVGGGN